MLNTMQKVHQWDYIEFSYQTENNPQYFSKSDLSAVFINQEKKITVHGFYNDNGEFIIRFMPEHEGVWEYCTISNIESLHHIQGEFECIAPRTGVKGLVQVADKTHFAYRDGTPFYPFGTTAYVWNYQDEAVQEKTLESLSKSPFNKLRMCVFPKHYTYNFREPKKTPFPGNIQDGFDFSRFDCEFFKTLEDQILKLQEMNIQVDLIIFHPYDRWGFSKMPENIDMRYVSYLVARLSSFRNIWWSLANEYDLLKEKSNIFWDKVFKLITAEDPYHHLVSIHNWHNPPIHYTRNEHWYDHKKAWATHASIQHHDMFFIPKWLEEYKKPVVIDECCYEGNVDAGWGNITAEKMVEMFWSGVARGAYVTHGETYLSDDDIIWWSHGGELKGQSPERIAFLRKIMEEGILKRFSPIGIYTYHWDTAMGANEDENYILMYFGEYRPKFKKMDMLPENKEYMVDIIDTWNMTIMHYATTIKKNSRLELPGQSYIALRLLAVDAK